MKKLVLLIAIIMIATACHAGEKEKKQQETLEVNFHKVEIKEQYVKEEMVIKNNGKKNYDGNITIWTNSPKVNVLFDGYNEEYNILNNTASINLKKYGIEIPPLSNISIRIQYEIKGKFEKKIIHRTKEMEIIIRTDKFVRGRNISLEYKNDFYYSSFTPKIGEIISIEFMEEKENDIIPFIMGLIAIFLGAIIIFLAARR
ncbi:MAG: hypothetical protein FE041_02720 [Thermoplasmata archaeon]|nr:MAG: hypothetical protein FE041_02720 [Thermoplasmata archaeon]